MWVFLTLRTIRGAFDECSSEVNVLLRELSLGTGVQALSLGCDIRVLSCSILHIVL